MSWTASALSLLAAVALVVVSGAARAADRSVTAAVFPFELLDSSQDGEVIIKVDPAETRRLGLLTEELRQRLTTARAFEIADLAPLAADIKSAAPLFKCNGCESDLAKKVGAKVAMLGVVQKFSDTLLSVSIQVVDVETGTVKGSYSAGVQGNTDEAWLRGVGYIVRNRILPVGEAR